MTGAVHYLLGAAPCFTEETVVQPDNQIPIPHADIIQQHGAGTFKIEGSLPSDFHERLRLAGTFNGRWTKCT